ncbi:MAG: sugar phosphate isomerase/epimerase [Ktedonobacteraceae bacterium]
MIRLSAFADEISADLDEQIAVLHSENISYLDLRSVDDTNVLDLTDAQIMTIKNTLNKQNIGVACIASPLGKVSIGSPFEVTRKKLERAIELAVIFQTPFIRIFSFYPPVLSAEDAESGEFVDPTEWRDVVHKRLHTMTEQARTANITLLHENEKDIYGDTIARCVDLLKSIDSANFQAAFDPANFVQCRQIPFPNAYEALRPWLRYMHVKDALADGSVVAAGEGEARWSDILQHLHKHGYDGFFSLEPHLALAGQFQGFSGPERFRHASQAFQKLLQGMHWEYE